MPKNSVWALSWQTFLEYFIKNSVEIATGAKAGKTWPANDDVVANFNFEELAGADEVASHLDVSFTRGLIPAGVLMCQDNGRRTGHHRQPKN